MSDFNLVSGRPPQPASSDVTVEADTAAFNDPTTTYNPIFAATLAPGTPITSTTTPNEVVAAAATSASSSNVIGVVSKGAGAGERGWICYRGPLELTPAEWAAAIDVGGALAVGAAYYVSPTTGKITQAMPSAAGQSVVPVGYAVTATMLFVQIGCGTSVPVSRDPDSGVFVPANNGEWSELILQQGLTTSGPTSIYPMQDAVSNGGLSDVNGLYFMGAVNPPKLVYQQPVSGWQRLGAGTIYNTADTCFVKQHGNLPDPSQNSFLLLSYVTLAAPLGADAGLMSLTDSALYGGIENGTMFPICGEGAEDSIGGAALPANLVFPIVLKYDITNQVSKFYTPYEILNRPWGAIASGHAEAVIRGNAIAANVHPATANGVYGAMWIGPTAEMEDWQVGAMLQALNACAPLGLTAPTWHGTPTPDATSGKFFPLDQTQWTDLGLTAPSFCWGMQETGGGTNAPFNDYIGNLGHAPLARSGTNVTLGNAVSGWARTAIAIPSGDVSLNANSTSSPLQPVSSTSQALLVLVQVNAGAGSTPYWSWICGFGTNQRVAMHVDTSGRFGIDVGASVPTHATGAIAQLGSVIPALLVYDRTNGRAIVYTPGEKITGTYDPLVTSTTPAIYFGSESGSIPTAGVDLLGAALWEGAAAEALSTDANARTLFETIGYPVEF